MFIIYYGHAIIQYRELMCTELSISVISRLIIVDTYQLTCVRMSSSLTADGVQIHVIVTINSEFVDSAFVYIQAECTLNQSESSQHTEVNFILTEFI